MVDWVTAAAVGAVGAVYTGGIFRASASIIAVAVARMEALLGASRRSRARRWRCTPRPTVVAVTAKLAVGVLGAQPTIITVAVVCEEARVVACCWGRRRWRRRRRRWRRRLVRMAAAAVGAVRAELANGEL